MRMSVINQCEPGTSAQCGQWGMLMKSTGLFLKGSEGTQIWKGKTSIWASTQSGWYFCHYVLYLTESSIEKAFWKSSKPAKGSEGEKHSTGENQQAEKQTKTHKKLQVSFSVSHSFKAKVVEPGLQKNTPQGNCLCLCLKLI